MTYIQFSFCQHYVCGTERASARITRALLMPSFKLLFCDGSVKSKFCDSQLYNSSEIDMDSVFVLVNLDLPCSAVNLNSCEAAWT